MLQKIDQLDGELATSSGSPEVKNRRVRESVDL
jgi:hypothetical protein